MNSPVKVAGYARCSTQGQAQDGVSIETQTKFIEDWAKREGLWLRAVYPDAGFTGGNRDRPMLKLMMEEAKTGWNSAAGSRDPSKSYFDQVLVYDDSRLSRDQIDSRTIVKELEAIGVAVRFGDMKNVNLQTPTGKLMHGVKSAVSEFERQEIAQRTKDAMAVEKEKGKHMGTIPWGFGLDEKGVLKVIDQRVWQIWKQYYWPPHAPVSRIASGLGLEYHLVWRLVKIRPKVMAAWAAAGLAPASPGSS